MKKRYFQFVFIILFQHLLIARAQTEKDLEIRVIDVGNGVCCVIAIPGGHYIVYDAGSREDKGKSAMRGLRKTIPKGTLIDLLVLSHPDDEHIWAADSIIYLYKPAKLIRTGYIGNPKKDSTDALRRLSGALREVRQTEDFNLHLEGKDIEPGMTIEMGDARAVFLCGFGSPPSTWELGKDKDALRDALSIVMRIEYMGKSVLFCGDALGWNEKMDDTECIAEEKFMIDHVPPRLLKSDVLIASQGGGIQGNSYPFIRKTQPEYVVFSAGNGKARAEPRYIIADRYKSTGTPLKNMFRTDRGDGFDYYPKPNVKPKQWDREGVDKCVDKPGDDDVRIIISGEGALKVAYYRYRDPCR